MRLETSHLAKLLRPWRQIAEKADAFFDRAQALSSGQIVCVPGCAGCCQDRSLTVMVVEALALLYGLQRLPAAKREALRAEAGTQRPGPCTLLVDDRCAVYEERPLICRTHGLAIRRPETPPGWASCELNFTTTTPPAEGILNESLLTAQLTVADAIVRREMGLEAPVRIAVADLVSRGEEALTSTAANTNADPPPHPR